MADDLEDLFGGPGAFRHKSRRWFFKAAGRCEACGEPDGVRLEPSRTAYDWDGVGRDPNAPILLCRPCAEDHHAHWDEMWLMYDNSRGI